jgi:integral membrane sensor domain MASE1
LKINQDLSYLLILTKKLINIALIMSKLTSSIKLLLKYTPDLKIVLAALLYFLAARLGHFLAFPDTTALPAWPPSGVAFALIILMGRSWWPTSWPIGIIKIFLSKILSSSQV